MNIQQIEQYFTTALAGMKASVSFLKRTGTALLFGLMLVLIGIPAILVFPFYLIGRKQ